MLLFYTVQPGDTLWAISRRYQVPLSEVTRANQLPDPNRLAVGQGLLIPLPDLFYYRVQPGDTLWRISRLYGVDIVSLVEANRIADPSLIYAGQQLRIPFTIRPRPTIEALGYLVVSSPAADRRVIENLGPYLTYVVPFAHRFTAEGSLLEINDRPAVEAARAQRVAPLLGIANTDEAGLFIPELAHSVLSRPEVQERLVSQLLAAARAKNYHGVNVDFENMFPADRPLYNAFIENLAGRLHAAGLVLSIAAAPKWADWPNAAWVGAFDYSALGRLVDFMHLMTYEWGYSTGPPFPVAPVNLVRRVLEYAMSLIPPGKILMGVPFHGYDWTLPDTPENVARQVSPVGAVNLALNQGVAIRFDPEAQSPWLRYTNGSGAEHEVWFEDVRSVRAKYELLRELGLRGVGYWEISLPFPQNWEVLTFFFEIAKVI
ncbi:MAG: LysM peptidoglycan-binding domain-containing protein [Syntrophomonadaceae bacterium]|nr:LysM peptidoglycan-binding domain-containing protein [Syntrophomonadaceae bacterium]